MRKAGKIALVVGSGFFVVQAMLSEMDRNQPVVQTQAPPLQARVAQSDMPLPANSSAKILSVPSMLVGGDNPLVASRLARSQGEGNVAVLTEPRVTASSVAAPSTSMPKQIAGQQPAPRAVAHATPRRYYAAPLVARMAPVHTHSRMYVVHPTPQVVYHEQPHGIRGFFANLGHKIHEKWVAWRD